MREIHTIKKAKGETAPRHVIFADTRLTLSPGIAGKVPPTFVPGPISTRLIDHYKDDTRVWQLPPMVAAEWLRVLSHRCRGGSSHWLVGRAIYQQLAAVGFFSQVDGVIWQMVAPPEGNGAHQRSKEWNGFVVIEDKTTIIVLRRVGGGVLHIVDTSNYGVDFADKWSDNPARNVITMADWWQAWTQWIRETKAGSVKYTIGAQAMALFKGRHLASPICVHTHEPALALEGKSLYGGRCEAYRIGRIPGKVAHLDARSLYGWCAATYQVPIALLGYAEGAPANGLIGHAGAVADVTLQLDEPAVPYRLPDNDLTVWPIGTFRTTLCAPELDLVRDRITEVHAVSYYHLDHALSSFARHCWYLRETERVGGNPLIYGQLKLFSQVLYGKFAQRYRGWRYSPGEAPPAPWSLWWQIDREVHQPCAWRSIAGRVEKHVDGGFTDQACPVISAWIASLARARLWQLMETAGRRNVYYCDTDSLFVSELGLQRLKEMPGAIGPELGQLRILGQYRDVEITGWKHYIAGGKLACAGFDRRAREGWATPAGPPRIEPVSAACAQKRPPLPIAQPDRVTFGSVYRHGQVLRDGRVIPFRVG